MNRPQYYKLSDGMCIPCEIYEVEIVHVAQSYLRPYTVSTVFIGIDHSFDSGPPVLFETMVFREGHTRDLGPARHSSLEDAMDFHRWTCQSILSHMNFFQRIRARWYDMLYQLYADQGRKNGRYGLLRGIARRHHVLDAEFRC